VSAGTVRGAALRLLIFAVVAGTIALLLYNTLVNTVGKSTVSYTAEFDDASGLHSGDNVRIAGVRVGRVDSVKLAGAIAQVSFSVQRDQPVLRNTNVAIRYQNLIGQRYLALVPGRGSAGLLEPGARIPRASTESALDLTVVLSGFQPLFDVISPDDVNRLSASVVAVLQGEGDSILRLLKTTAELAGRLADRDAVIGRVITNLGTVLTEVANRDGDVDALIGELRRLVAATAADREKIGGSIQALGSLTDATAALLRDVRPQLKKDLVRLEKVAGIYAREKTAFADTVKGLPVALRAFARTMQYGSWINLYICNVYYLDGAGKRQQFGDASSNSAVCA
jgi:phospholipid/cholesterol/gamma-HCH transport system substrate-binding protein